MTAITAVTAQNTKGVSSVISIKPKDIEKQILFTCKDIKPNAIKIGMLHSSEIINSVNRSLKKINSSKDYFRSCYGSQRRNKINKLFSNKDLKRNSNKKLFITPNIPEAEVLTNTKIRTIRRHDICRKCFARIWC